MFFEGLAINIPANYKRNSDDYREEVQQGPRQDFP